MRTLGKPSSLLALAVYSLLSTPAVGAGDVDKDISFFEKKIRPVLVEHCYSCHSNGANKVRGGLRLDSRAGMLAGGDTGPTLVAGKPSESLIVEALRYEGLEMPPKGKLAPAVVTDFERWIT
ncbi:c-type cytochrome domain-containing protein, partial [Singulisphaera rosea]